MNKLIRIGTRESQLAVWQAEQVKNLLAQHGFASELVHIKSEGDIDLVTPLYEMGVQGVFTRSLDIALLNDKIDIAVHSMKDVPTQLARGIVQAAVLKRASHKDVLVPHPDLEDISKIFGRGIIEESHVTIIQEGSKSKEIKDPRQIEAGEKVNAIIATSSIRRKAQWLNRFPHHTIETLRGNVNTRLRKLKESNWHGAIFAKAGLERIDLLPENSIELDWMLSAPAQGAIMVVCREDDEYSLNACVNFNDVNTALCTKIERDFLRTLLGGCSTPISGFAEIKNNEVYFTGNILSPDGKLIAGINASQLIAKAQEMGINAANHLLTTGGKTIADSIRMQNKISILSTRPLDASLIEEAKQLNIEIDVISFIETEPIRSKKVQQEIENALLQSSTVVFTSMNAVEMVANELEEHYPDWKIYSIGSATSKLVKKYFGEDALAGTANSAAELAELIADDSEDDEVIFFCGDQRRDELPDILRHSDISVHEIAVYETVAVRHKVEKHYHAILFFSPSAVDSFFRNNKIEDSTVLFAIGNTTANALKKYSTNKIIISDEPGKLNLFRKMLEYFGDVGFIDPASVSRKS